MIKVKYTKEKQTGNETLFYLSLALIPILSLYDFLPLVYLGYGLALIAILFKIAKNNFIAPINLNLATVMGVFIGINLIVGGTRYSNFTNTLNNTLAMVVFTILAILICNPKILNIEKLYKACKVIGYLSTVFLLYQFTAYYAFDIVVKGDIPFLTLNDIGFSSIEYGRPTSFFLEPAHYALYIAPIYAMSIIKKEYLTSLFFLIGLVFSTATTGTVVGIILPIIIIFSHKNKFSLKNMLLILFAFTALQLVTTSFFENILSKITYDHMFSSSRIFGTLYVFDYFGLSEWLLGIGINRMPDFLEPILNITIKNYANSIMFSIISFGLIGGITLIIYLHLLYRKTPDKYKVIWIVLVLFLVSDQILFNRNLLYLFIWQYAALDSNLKKKKISGLPEKEVQYEQTPNNHYNTCL